MAREEAQTSTLARDAHGVLRLGGVALDEALLAARVSTPAYVYDLDAIVAGARSLVASLRGHGLACYAIKANAAAPIVRAIVGAGCGIDVVSGGELALALACGAAPANIVYSGVAKRDDEIDAALAHGIKGIHAESVEEVQRIAARAKALGRRAHIGLRVNPSVEADTHDHIATGHDEAKFGISREDLPRALEVIASHSRELQLVALSTHVGSMLMTAEPYVAGVRAIAAVAREVNARFPLEYLDTGGGFAVPYRDEQHPANGPEMIAAGRAALDAAGFAELAMVVEPGRVLVAPHGVLVASVIQEKRAHGDRRWLFVDAGMNDLIRPALYQAHHRFEPLFEAPGTRRIAYRVAGPVCESSDDFGVHELPDPAPAKVAIREAGAYGRSMASTYNARPIASEVFLAHGAVAQVRAARSIDAYVADETRP